MRFSPLAGALVVAVWVYLLVGRGRFWLLRAPAPPDALPLPPPAVAAVIPARNEARTVRQAVASLLEQDYRGPLRVFLVDDHSTDGTADIVRALGAVTVTVLAAPLLAPGWTGKLSALAEGVRRAQPLEPEYYLFTDADVAHSPDSVSALVARAEAGRLDLASVMVRLRCETLAERLLIPAFVFFFFKLYPPAWTSDARRATAGAAGGCLLIRRAALERIGGIEAIRGELIDDCALARAVKRSGGRLWLGLTSTSRSLREYGALAEVGRMVSRSAFTQLNHSALLLAGTVAAMLLVYLLPPLLVFAPLPAAAGGALAWVLMSVAYAPALRFCGRSPAWAPLLPLAALFYTGATIHSAVRYWRGAGGVWKGRVQDGRG